MKTEVEVLLVMATDWHHLKLGAEGMWPVPEHVFSI